jgi:chaperone BCS1
MPISELLGTLANNQFFSAGVGLLGAGAGLAVVRKAYQHALIHARRALFVSLEIPSKDKSFHWILDWLSEREGENTQHVSASTSFVQHESGDVNAKVDFLPSVGTHFFTYRGRIIKVDRTREKNVIDVNTGSLWESVTFTTIGRKKNVFYDMINEAMMKALEREEGKTIIYTSAGSDWRRFGHPRRKRPLHSVILGEGESDMILKDVKDFLSRSSWYIDRGIPYRRGYLLYGPPGSGKSSFITALAGELNLSICILSLNSKNISDNVLNNLLSNAPQRSIILLEDVDAAVNRAQAPSQEQNVLHQYAHVQTGVTFSGLLNALDGVAASEGRVLFMTTNHIERLDPALIRPGRVDKQVLMGDASKYQIRAMFLKFYPDAKKEVVDKFVDQVPTGKVSMAHLQGYFMLYKDDPKAATENAHTLVPTEQQQTITT